MTTPEPLTQIIKVQYKTYAIGRLDRAANGTSQIQVQSSDGKACQILVETLTDKVLDVQGDQETFMYWVDNEKKRVA